MIYMFETLRDIVFHYKISKHEQGYNKIKHLKIIMYCFLQFFFQIVQIQVDNKKLN